MTGSAETTAGERDAKGERRSLDWARDDRVGALEMNGGGATIGVMATANAEGTRAPGTLAARVRRDAPFFLIAALVLGLDQLTKSVIRTASPWASPGRASTGR